MDRYQERTARPTLGATDRREETEASVSRPATHVEKKQKKNPLVRVLVIVGSVLVVGAIASWFFLRNVGIPSYVDTEKYQVACLTSGECYFGKITAVSSEDVRIKNVFYVQNLTDTPKDESSAGNNRQLTKLGNEVHGPEDMMVINRSHILYIENLKSDGQVTQKINEYYKQNKQ